MARRYRYAIIKKKEAAKGKLSVGLAIASLLLFGGAVGIAYVLEGSYGFIVGGICLFAALLSAVPSKFARPCASFGKMCRYPVQNNSNLITVQIIDHILEILNRTITGGWCIISCDLISP